jgi:hypothetical protein
MLKKHTGSTWAYIYTRGESGGGQFNNDLLERDIRNSSLSSQAKSALINVDSYGSDSMSAVYFDDRSIASGLDSSDESILGSVVSAHVGTPNSRAKGNAILEGTSEVGVTSYTSILTFVGTIMAPGMWILKASGELTILSPPSIGPNTFLDGRITWRPYPTSSFAELAVFSHLSDQWDTRTIIQCVYLPIASTPEVSLEIRTTNVSNKVQARRWWISLSPPE